MREGKGLLYFCSAEEDSLYAIRFLYRQKAERGLSDWEERQLAMMDRRLQEARIYLVPAVVYATANQRGCETWLQRAQECQKKEWYESGIAWMRRCPGFLERFGWRERKSAVMAAGILSEVENGDGKEARETLCRFLCSGFRILWEQISHSGYLDAESWRDMGKPWQDSDSMSNGICGVLLLMANLLGKPIYERDQLTRDFYRLRTFTAYCLRKPVSEAEEWEEVSDEEEYKLEWLMHHFKNPQRLCYLQEKGRFDSEWQGQLFKVMRMAGLPVSACETVSLSGQEVRMLLGELEGRLSPQKYMTFLALYTLAKELAQAGRAAAALDLPGR